MGQEGDLRPWLSEKGKGLEDTMEEQLKWPYPVDKGFFCVCVGGGGQNKDKGV